MMKFALRSAGAGHSSIVELDGVDVSAGVYAVELHVEANHEPARVTLHLGAVSTDVETEGKLHITSSTIALLKQLGWTPPEENS